MRHEFRLMAILAAVSVKDGFSGQDPRVIQTKTPRHAKTAQIEGHKVKALTINLQPVMQAGFLTMFGANASRLTDRAICSGIGMRGRRNPNVPGKGSGGLFLDRWHPELDRGHDLCPTGYAIAIRIVGVGKGKDVGNGDSFQQAKTDHLRCHAGRQKKIGSRGTIGRVRGGCGPFGDAFGQSAAGDRTGAGTSTHARLRDPGAGGRVRP